MTGLGRAVPDRSSMSGIGIKKSPKYNDKKHKNLFLIIKWVANLKLSNYRPTSKSHNGSVAQLIKYPIILLLKQVKRVEVSCKMNR